MLYFVIFFEVRVKKEGDFFVAEQKKYNILALSYLLMHNSAYIIYMRLFIQTLRGKCCFVQFWLDRF